MRIHSRSHVVSAIAGADRDDGEIHTVLEMAPSFVRALASNADLHSVYSLYTRLLGKIDVVSLSASNDNVRDLIDRIHELHALYAGAHAGEQHMTHEHQTAMIALLNDLNEYMLQHWTSSVQSRARELEFESASAFTRTHTLLAQVLATGDSSAHFLRMRMGHLELTDPNAANQAIDVIGRQMHDKQSHGIHTLQDAFEFMSLIDQTNNVVDQARVKTKDKQK